MNILYILPSHRTTKYKVATGRQWYQIATKIENKRRKKQQ